MSKVFVPLSLNEINTHKSYIEILKKFKYVPVMPDENYSSTSKPWTNSDLILPPVIVKLVTFWTRVLEIDPTFDNDKIKKAIIIAKDVHTKTKRRNNNNTFNAHILPVALFYLISQDKLKKQICKNSFISCILHDTLEDSDGLVVVYKNNNKTNTKYILEDLFDKEICNTVSALTKPLKVNGILNWPEYTQQIKSDSNAILIKCIDRILNLTSDVQTHQNGNKEQRIKYLKESKLYIEPLLKLIDPYYTKVYDIVFEAVKYSNNITDEELKS